jgi:DNA polymerase I
VLYAGERRGHKLEDCVQRELGRGLNKDQQRSDWSAPELSREQLRYAAEDVRVLLPLYRALAKKLDAAGLGRVAEVECRCLPAVAWMARSGVALDRPAWESRARAAMFEADELCQRLDAAARPKDGYLTGMGAWDWDSPQQAREALAAVGCPVESTRDEALALIDHPVAALLREYRSARKRVTTYGTGWLSHVAPDGRVYPQWKQLKSRAGRMACADPNLQQLPRGVAYRRCVAAPPGRVLVKADYSQIELRIAALVAGEGGMVEAFARGEDLHTLTAQRVLGVQEVSKAERQLAKAVNFGLLYGMGAKGFRIYARSQYGLTLSLGEAGRYRDAFFRAYPGLASWRARVRRGRCRETRTLAGRRRLLPGGAPDTWRLNSPVQGTGLTG